MIIPLNILLNMALSLLKYIEVSAAEWKYHQILGAKLSNCHATLSY